MKRYRVIPLSLALLVISTAHQTLWAQCIPVTSEPILNACGVCHRADSHNCMSRISYQRKTPEGWEDTVRRMGRMNGIPSSATQARAIIHYLADNQGLTPSEVKGVAYALEQRRDVEEKIPDADVKDLCTKCHSYARIAGERRSKEEWLKLKDFHIASFPEGLNSPDWVNTADKALNELALRFPLDTPEWEHAKGHQPPGKSTWLVKGHLSGRGDYIGTFNMEPGPRGIYQTALTMEFTDGKNLSGKGEGIWYGGSAWRGTAVLSNGDRIREVLELSNDGKTMQGRWFFKEHPEFGGDQICYLDSGTSKVLAVLPKALNIRSSETKIKLLGINLPAHPKVSDLNLGAGVKVDSILDSTGSIIVATVSVLEGASVGRRSVQVEGAIGRDLLGLYYEVDYIRVLPERGGARMGGVNIPKQFEQFEAVAYSDGPDGIPGTPDDFEIGIVHASWEIENYYATFSADDQDFVGTIDENGLFTPSVETPNPKRAETLNNAGSVWVVARYTPPDTKQSLQARAYLLVAFPLFVKHEMP